jgi:nucleotide-binding universal stress UspA family protein
MRVLVGVDEREQARDALRLGAQLAAVEGGSVVVAHVYPHDPTYGYDPAFARDLRRRAQERLERLRAELPDAAFEERLVESTSIPRALLRLVEQESADLLVVGSSHRSSIGRVVFGSVGERLLHGAPCPLAVAPAGFRPEHQRPERIVVGYDGSAEAQGALRLAERLAAASAARLELVAVVDTSWAGDLVEADLRARERARDALAERLRTRLDEGLASLGGGVEATTQLRSGSAVRELLEAAEEADLLVVGSRGYGPVGLVLLGSTAVEIMRRATRPVVVLPRHGQQAGAAGAEQGVASADAARA